jgi:hypothetical protein
MVVGKGVFTWTEARSPEALPGTSGERDTPEEVASLVPLPQAIVLERPGNRT